MAVPIGAVPVSASGDGYKDRAALRNNVLLAARVCLKHMLHTKKPTDFVSVTDLVAFLRTNSGFRVAAEVTRTILTRCGAPTFTIQHYGAAQILRDNNPDEVPEFAEYCATHPLDIAGLQNIVVHGDGIMLMPGPPAGAVSQRDVQMVPSAALVHATSCALGPPVDCVSQDIVPGGCEPCLGFNAVAQSPRSGNVRPAARPAAARGNDSAAFKAPPTVETLDLEHKVLRSIRVVISEILNEPNIPLLN